MSCRRSTCMHFRYARVNSVQNDDDELKLMGAREVNISLVMT